MDLSENPHGFTTITPFIVVKDPGEAIAYYKTVFNVRIKDITEFTAREWAFGI